MGAGFTLAVALMQPAPPSRMFCEQEGLAAREDVEAATAAKASSIALRVASSRRELSFTPATVPG